jgi:hypothetical protein
MHALALALPIFAAEFYGLPRGVMLAALVCAAIPASFHIARGRDGAALNLNLAMFGVTLYLYGIAFAAGMAIDWGNR